MLNLFWNQAEHRLRAFWRLIVYSLMIGLFMQVLDFLVEGLSAVLSLSTAGGVVFGGNFPLIQILNGLITLIAMLGATFLAGWRVDRRVFADFGFHFDRHWWADLAFGLALGAVLMALIFLAEWAAGWIQISGTLINRNPDWSFTAWVLTDAIFFLCVGIYEELFSRGYLLRTLAEGLRISRVGPKTALLIAYLISSSVFGLLHLANDNASLTSTLNLVLAGLFLGLGYVLTGELGISIGLHITWNFFQGVVFGFPVSGGTPAASFIGIQQFGPNWATGGAFGPEAGIISLVAMLLGSGLILLWVRRTRGGPAFQHRLAVYQTGQPETIEAAPAIAEQPAQ